MDAFERAKRRYYNHTPIPQAAEYVKQLEARLEALEAERDELAKRLTMLERGLVMLYILPNMDFLHSQQAMRAFLRAGFPDIDEMVKRHK